MLDIDNKLYVDLNEDSIDTELTVLDNYQFPHYAIIGSRTFYLSIELVRNWLSTTAVGSVFTLS